MLSVSEPESFSSLSLSSTGGKSRGILGCSVKSGTSICSSYILLIALSVKSPRLWSNEWRMSLGFMVSGLTTCTSRLNLLELEGISFFELHGFLTTWW